MNRLTHNPLFDSASENNNSFAWQYTSLMIMILAFVIGAFTGGNREGVIKVVEPNVNSRPQAPIKIAKNGFLADDIFQAGSSNINQEKYEALITVLMNHDISLQIELFGERCNPDASEECRKLLFERAEKLLEKFTSKEVPSGSVKIFVVGKEAQTQGKISYFEDVI